MRLAIIPKKTVQLNYVKSRLCARPCGEERQNFPTVSLVCQNEKERRFVDRVETLDQMVEVNFTTQIKGVWSFRSERSGGLIYLGLRHWNRALSSRAKLSSLCTRSS